MTRILAVDVGNTKTKIALCDCGDSGLPVCLERHAADQSQPADAGGLLASLPGYERSVISGSNTARTRELLASWPRNVAQPLVIDHHQQLSLDVAIADPESAGLDRLLNAEGIHRLGHGRATVVVDAGTATTVDVVDRQGAFRGGAILPGLALAAKSLHTETDALPRIETTTLSGFRLIAPAGTTVDAIGTGVFCTQTGAIKELLARYQETLGEIADLCLTGGGAEQLVDAFPEAKHMPALSLRALAALAADIPA